MANVLTEERLVDKGNRAVLKYTGILDTVVADGILIDTRTLQNALNSNGYIMSSNVDPLPAYLIDIKRAWGVASLTTGYIKLRWDGDENTMLTIGNGSFNFYHDDASSPAVINNINGNTTGNVLITVSDVTANDHYTIFLEVSKNTSHYDQGQTADPAAFNAGDFGIV